MNLTHIIANKFLLAGHLPEPQTAC